MGADTAYHYEYYPYVNLGHYALYPLVDKALQDTLAGYYRHGLDGVAQDVPGASVVHHHFEPIVAARTTLQKERVAAHRGVDHSMRNAGASAQLCFGNDHARERLGRLAGVRGFRGRYTRQKGQKARPCHYRIEASH